MVSNRKRLKLVRIFTIVLNNQKKNRQIPGRDRCMNKKFIHDFSKMNV